MRVVVRSLLVSLTIRFGQPINSPVVGKLVSSAEPVLAIVARLNSVCLCANIGAECLARDLSGTDLLAILGFDLDLGQNIRKQKRPKSAF